MSKKNKTNDLLTNCSTKELAKFIRNITFIFTGMMMNPVYSYTPHNELKHGHQ